MSSTSSNTVALYNFLQIYSQRIGDSILVAFGTISCVFSLLIFTQKDLRKSPCAIYFIAHNIGNLLYIYFAILITLLGWDYSIDPSTYDIVYCRFRFYVYLLFGTLSPFYLILASVDRVLITSKSIRIRRWSTRRVAYVTIFGMTLFWMIFNIHTLIYVNIYPITAYCSLCTYAPGIYNTLINYYQLMVRGLFVILLMLIFSLWTVKNLRSVHRIAPAASTQITRIPVVNGPQRFTQKDRQFILMLFIDIIVYILCIIPRPIYTIYIQVTQYETKSNERLAIETFVNSLTLFINFIPTCTGFYTNFLVSKTFRQNLKKIFQNCFCQQH